MRKKININLVLDGPLMRRINSIVKWEKSNRTALIRRAIEQYVADAEARLQREASANDPESES